MGTSTILAIEKLHRRDQLNITAECVRCGHADISDLTEMFWDGLRLDRHQRDILHHIILGMEWDISEIAVKGCAGSGKGASLAMGVCMWFELAPVCKIILVSSSYEHVIKGLFSEVIKWRKKMRFEAQGEVFATEIKVSEQKRIVCLNPKAEEGLAGWHGRYTAFFLDEATGVTEKFFDIAGTQAKIKVAISNPRVSSGWFRRLFAAADPDETQTIKMPNGTKRRLITIAGTDCLNVVEGQIILEGQITRQRLAAIMAHPDPDWRRVMGEGKFPREDRERQLIMPSWLHRHWQVWHKNIEVECFGLDVGDSADGDPSCLAAGGEQGLCRLHIRKEKNTMGTVGWVLGVARKKHGIDLTRGENFVCVDADGIGKGVADRLEEEGVKVISHFGESSPEEKQMFKNKRAETWGNLALRLDPEGPWGHTPWAVPRDELLLEDMTAQEKMQGSDPFRFKLLPKDTRDGTESLKKKIGRSPDRGDAAAYLWAASCAQMAVEAEEGCGDMIAGVPDDTWSEGELKERRKKGSMDAYLEEVHKFLDMRERDRNL